MRIAIYGAGALGGYYGARLSEAGHAVGFIARGAHLQAIRDGGLRISSPDGDLHLASPLATDNPADIGPVDLVIVAVKTWQVPEIAKAMRPLLTEDTVVLPFLNGVEASSELAEVIGPDKVLGGLSKVFCLIESPGLIRHFKPGAYVSFGEIGGGPSPRTGRLKAMFDAAGIEADVSGDIGTDLWCKLLMVSSWAGLGALSRSPIGAVRQEPGTRAIVDRCMDEGIAVGRAAGHAIGPSFKGELWTFYDSLPPEATASMQRDVIAGRPSEVDAWNGAIVRFGKSFGVETPTHDFTYAALKLLEKASL